MAEVKYYFSRFRKNKADFIIAIPCYEVGEHLTKCLKSIDDTVGEHDVDIIVYVEKQSVSLNRIGLLQHLKDNHINPEFILWCDDDVIFENNNWADRFLERMQNPKIGVVTCQVNDFQGRPVPQQPHGYVWASSGTVMFCRNIAAVTPDTGFIKALWEDIDLQVQYRVAGYRVYCDSFLTVLHLNMGRNPAMSENQKYFYEKWGARLSEIPI